MPIQFQCGNCQSSLSTPDDSAGKSAECPNCGGVVPIPVKPLNESPDLSSNPYAAAANPFSKPQAGIGAGPSVGAGNPYVAGMSTAPKMTPARARARVQPAATAWLIISVAVALFCLLAAMGEIFNIAAGQALPEDVPVLITMSIFGLFNVFGVVGAISMLRMRNRKLAIAASICTMIGGVMCCLLPTGISVWALVVLLDSNLKPYFSQAA